MNSSAGPEWHDLASNRPGAAARARAAELRARHPFMVTAAKTLGIRTEAESFAIGAKGERQVGRKLNRWATQNGWHVLHAIPVSRSGTDIDHVIVGSFGVVTVNTKTTKTRVWVGEYGMTVGGKTVDYLRKSRAEARRAAQALTRATRIEVPVRPVIVFTGGGRVFVAPGGAGDGEALAQVVQRLFCPSHGQQERADAVQRTRLVVQVAVRGSDCQGLLVMPERFLAAVGRFMCLAQMLQGVSFALVVTEFPV